MEGHVSYRWAKLALTLVSSGWFLIQQKREREREMALEKWKQKYITKHNFVFHGTKKKKKKNKNSAKIILCKFRLKGGTKVIPNVYEDMKTSK